MMGSVRTKACPVFLPVVGNAARVSRGYHKKWLCAIGIPAASGRGVRFLGADQNLSAFSAGRLKCCSLLSWLSQKKALRDLHSSHMWSGFSLSVFGPKPVPFFLPVVWNAACVSRGYHKKWLCAIGIPAASGRGVRFLGADQNLSAFCQAEAFYRSMNSSPDQSDLFPGFVPAPQMVFVNDRVSFQTEAKQRVILVHGVAYSHYSLEDRIAEAYALVKLYESGYADQNDLARAFGYSTRTLRRFQQRLHRGGLNALIRPQGRPAEDSISHIAPRDRIILRLKAQGLSNRGIAGRIGLDEKMIRKTLRRLGWRPAPEATLPLLPRADPPAPSAAVSESPADPIPPPETPQAVLQEPPEAKPATPSFDPNPLDRSLDRLLAALGRSRERSRGFGSKLGVAGLASGPFPGSSVGRPGTTRR